MVKDHSHLSMDALTLPPPFSVVVIWIYNRTSLFSLGITMTEPEFAECMAHLIRISAERGQLPDVRRFLKVHTKVCNWNDVKNTPYIIRLFTFQAVSKLCSSPRVSAIASNHVLRPNSLTSSSSPIGSRLVQEFLGIIWGHIAAEQSVRYGPVCGFALLWICLLFCQVLQHNLDWICIFIFGFRLVIFQGFRKDAAFDSYIAMGFEGIEEETFNSTCWRVKSVIDLKYSG